MHFVVVTVIAVAARESQSLFQVIKAENKFVWIDIGHKGVTRVAKKELNLSQLVVSRVERSERKGRHDVRIGDVLTFVIENLETPFGDMTLTARELPS